MTKPAFKFTKSIGTRGDVPIIIGVAGPSFSGKTLSMIRMAEGVRRVIGSTPEQTFVIDTENGRATHYCPIAGQKAKPPETYSFSYISLGEPYSSQHYLSAIDYAINNDAKIIIVDQFSFEHEGQGGYLDYHASEVDRLVREWKSTEEKVHWPAFNRPSQDRKKLINRLTTSPVKYFFCGFRARPKTAKGKDDQGRPTILDLGYQPVGGEAFWYEMTVRILLYPGSAGVPVWTPDHNAEKELIKLPQYMKHLFSEEDRQLDESIGEELAKWSTHGVKATESGNTKKLLTAFASLSVTQEMIEARLGHSIDQITNEELEQLREVHSAIKKEPFLKDKLFEGVA